MTPGFYFSALNHDMVSQNPAAGLNILWNQLNEDLKAKSSLFTTPTFDPSIGYTYPEFGAFGNSLLDPQLAIKQTMQSFQNGSWMNGMGNFGGFGGFGNFGFGNFGFGNTQNIWGNFQTPWSNNSNSTATSAADRKKQTQYDKLRKVLTEYKKNLSEGNDERILIETALNKSGKIEEKLEALKNVAKKLNSNSIQKALLNMDATKIELDSAGYKIDDKKTNTELKQNLNNLEKDIKAKKADLTTATVCTSENDPNILRTLSFWNDTHNSNENRNIIRLIANYLPTGSGEGTNQKASVNNIAQSLVNYVETVKSKFDVDVDFSKLDKSKQEVADALSKCSENFTKENINKLAEKVDDLYARLRLIEAERIKNNLKKEYKELNDLTGKDIVNDKLIVKATEDDLKNEGISIPSSRDTVPYTEEPKANIREEDDPKETADEKIEKLTKSGDDKALKASAKAGVYQTETVAAGENPKFYTKNDDDKLVELKDVKAIDKDGKCTMIDGSKKSLSQVEKVEVQKADVQAYNDEMKKVKKLLDNGTIIKCSNQFKGKNLYKSKGKKVDGFPQYFTVVDGELKRVDCKYVQDGAQKVSKEDGTNVSATDFSDYCSISESEIITEDRNAIANAERQKEVNELVKNDKLRTTNCKKPMVYSTTQKVGDRYRHYIISNGEIYELDGVTIVYGNGNCRKDGKVYKISNTTEIKRVKVSASDIETNGADSSDSVADDNSTPSSIGKVIRERLHGGTTASDYTLIMNKMENTFEKYTDPEDIVSFIEGYNEQKSPIISWNDELCAQISSENKMGWKNKDKCLRIIAKQMLKVMDKLGIDKNSYDYTEMLAYSKVGTNSTSNDDSCNAWRNVAGFWKSWSAWNSERTGAANHMDDIIERVLKQYREKFPKGETTTET